MRMHRGCLAFVVMVMAVPVMSVAQQRATGAGGGSAGSAVPMDELSAAAANGDVARLKALLGAGADLSLRNKYSQSALDASVLFDKPVCTRLLLQHHANVDAENAWGQTALYLGAESGRQSARRAHQ